MKSPWGIDQLRSKDNIDALNAAQKQAIEDEYRLYAQCFCTEAGQQVLARMKALIEDQPTWNPDMKPEYGYYREGQNDVLRHIVNRIKHATKK